MTNENICKWEKFGYCRKKNDCPDYHPIEVCNEEVCNESKCHKRYPQPCRFFRTGTCKFGESCKYDHKQQIKNKELRETMKILERNDKEHIERIKKLETKDKENVDKINNLEIENKRIRDLNLQQADSILNLHQRLNHLEKEYVIILRNQIEERKEGKGTLDEELKLDRGTLVCDDQTKLNEQVDENIKNASKEELASKIQHEKYDLETALYNLSLNLSSIKDEMKNKNIIGAKKLLEEFRFYVNDSLGTIPLLPNQRKLLKDFNIICDNTTNFEKKIK